VNALAVIPGLGSRRMRGLILQAVVLAAVVGTVIWLGVNAANAIARQNIATGFSFLEQVAGFDIIQHLIPYSETSSYGRALVVGLINTLLVAVLGIVFATVLGFAAGIARLSENWLIRVLSGAYVEILRNTPLLLQIFFWYFAVLRALPSARESQVLFDAIFINNRGFFLPRLVPEPGFALVAGALVAGLAGALILVVVSRRRRERTGSGLPILWPVLGLVVVLPLVAMTATGFPWTFDVPRAERFNIVGGMMIIPELTALFLALSLYTGAFIAEIVRAGILGVPTGQREAALAVGLSQGQMLRLVVVPQAMRLIIPPLTSQYLNLTKNSSLAVAIAYPDLVSVFAGTTLNQTGQAIEVLAITMLIYLTLSLMTSLAMNIYNRSQALKER